MDSNYVNAVSRLYDAGIFKRKESMQLYNGIKVFSGEEMYRIHQAALNILEEIGLEIELSEASLKKLAQQGLKVDFSTRRVRFPAEVIRETIQQLSGAPVAEINEQGTARPVAALRIPQKLEATVGALHGFMYDMDLGRMRPAKYQDLYDLLKVKKRLKDVDASFSGVCPQDIPQDVASVHAAAFAVKYCHNPTAPDVNGIEDQVWVERIMQVSGAWKPGQHQVVAIYPISPLRLAGRGAEMMEFQASRGDLSWVIGMVIPGASSPITLVSHTVIVLAEEFGFSTAYRLLVPPPNNRFKPHCIGDDVCVLDLRRGTYILSSPEISLLRLATNQIAGEFYKFPQRSGTGIRFFPNAQEPGIQAATEGALMAMGDLCQGTYSEDPETSCKVGILGSLSANLSLCLEEAVIDHEMFQYLQRFVRGMKVDDVTLALDEIERVGPGGNFLSTEHTAHNYRKEMWFPQLSHRGAWDSWVDSGRQTPLDLARERVKTYLKDDLEPVLDDGRIKMVNQVVQEAEIALLGEITGRLP
jgi:trimethylamine---corrinoid protein Co-methyltransferase